MNVVICDQVDSILYLFHQFLVAGMEKENFKKWLEVQLSAMQWEWHFMRIHEMQQIIIYASEECLPVDITAVYHM